MNLYEMPEPPEKVLQEQILEISRIRKQLVHDKQNQFIRDIAQDLCVYVVDIQKSRPESLLNESFLVKHGVINLYNNHNLPYNKGK